MTHKKGCCKIRFYNSPSCRDNDPVEFVEAGEIKSILSAAVISHGVSHISYRIAVFHPSEGRISLGLLFCNSPQVCFYVERPQLFVFAEVQGMMGVALFGDGSGAVPVGAVFLADGQHVPDAVL